MRTTDAVYANYKEIVLTLPQVSGKNFDGDEIAEGKGILCM